METLLKYRKIVWIFVLLFIITGIFTYIQIPKRDIPEISQNIASVSTVYPGANPEVVEQVITNKIEDELETVDGVDQLTSASTNGFSTITISLTETDNPTSIYAAIRQAVQNAQKDFPDEALTPEVKTDLVRSSVATYHLLNEDTETLLALRETIASWEEEFTSISGVDSIEWKGIPDQYVEVQLDQEALGEYRVQPGQIIEAIQAELGPVALGTETTDDQNFLLNIAEEDDFTRLEQTYITTNGDEPIYLVDIASIAIVDEKVSDIITYDDKQALSLTIYAKDGVNITNLQKQIDDKMAVLQQDLPEEVVVDNFYTQSTIIDEVYTSLLVSFAISFFAVVIIMVLGLPISSAILVAFAIPLSIIIGFIPLPYTGVDLNQISIIGIIVAIGILVDDAIVVNDNIMRRYQLGDSPLEGARRGIKEVGVSIVTSTLLIVFSFLPLTFLSGSNGEFIRALPIALMGTIIASTILALTVIPSIQYVRQLRIQQTKKRRKGGLLTNFFRFLEKHYAENIIPFTIKRPWLTVLSGIIICLLLLSLALKVPFEFFPAADRQEVTLSLTLDEGTKIEDTDAMLDEIEAYILEQEPNVTETVRYTGSGLPNIFNSSLTRSGENTGQLAIRIDRDNYSAQTFIEDYERELRETFPEGQIFLETIVSGPPASAALEVKLQGPELDTLLSTATALQEDLNALDAVEIATINTGTSQPVKTYEIDKAFLAENGIDLNQVKNTLQLANTGVPFTEISVDNQRYTLEISLDEGLEDGIALDQLQAVVPSERGAPSIFTYDKFITETVDEQIAAITHLDGERTITIEAYENSDVATFTGDTEEIIDTLQAELPEGYTLIEDGESSAETEFFIEVAKLFVIVLFLIYVTLAIQFNSLLTPLLITSTVLIAVTGAIAGLFVSGQPLSFLAVLGIVSLSGVVVRNSILIIEFIEQNKARYQGNIKEAIIAAGKARLRPIILTTLTSIAALAPIIFTGDVLFKPLAVSIVAGLIFSTTLTLLLLPASYVTMAKMIKK